MTTNLLSLVALLILLAGVIAYAGDRLGMLVARHRLSLFGVRPRYTGRIVGVVAGILIMLTTFGVLALAFRGAAQIIINAQQVGEELNRLRAERRALEADIQNFAKQIQGLEGQLAQMGSQLGGAQAALDAAQADLARVRTDRDEAREQVDRTRAEVDWLQAEVDSVQWELAEAMGQLSELESQFSGTETALNELNSQAEILRLENAALQVRNDQLSETSQALSRQNTSLEMLNDQLRTEIIEANDQVGELKARVDGFQVVLEGQAAELVRAREQFEQVTGGQVVYTADALVYSGLLYATDIASAREELSQFIRSASEETLLKGAGEVRLRADQFEGLVTGITQTPGVDLILLVSPRNQFRSEDIVVSVEALPNSKLFDRGQLISSRQIHLGSEELQASQAEIRNALAQLVAETRVRLTTAGLFMPDLPQLTQSEESFSNQLLRLTGPVTIGVIAAEEIYRAGPALIEMLILH